MASNKSGSLHITASGAQPDYKQFSQVVLQKFKEFKSTSTTNSGNSATTVSASSSGDGQISLDIHVSDSTSEASQTAASALGDAIRSLGGVLQDLTAATQERIMETKTFANWADQLQQMMNGNTSVLGSNGMAKAHGAAENLLAALSYFGDDGKGRFEEVVSRRLASAIGDTEPDSKWTHAANNIYNAAKSMDSIYAQQLDRLDEQYRFDKDQAAYERGLTQAMSSYASGVNGISKQVDNLVHNGIQTKMPGADSKQESAEKSRREDVKTKQETKAAHETEKAQRILQKAQEYKPANTERDSAGDTGAKSKKPSRSSQMTDEEVVASMSEPDRRQYDRMVSQHSNSELGKKLIQHAINQQRQRIDQADVLDAISQQPQQPKETNIETKGDVNVTGNKAPVTENNGGGGGGGPGGGGPNNPPNNPPSPPNNPPSPPNPKERPMYLNKLSELTDLLDSEGLTKISQEVKRQLTVLKSDDNDPHGSSASNITATFGNDGKFQGFTLKAKSITLGDVDTATMSYKVGDDMVTTTRANQDKLAKFTERLAQDTASAEQQFNMWMGHSALQSKDASGHNNRVDQLMGYLTGSNGQQLGYVDKKGQVQIGRLNTAGQKETLTRTELDELQNNLGVFRNEMSVLNRSMRQDFAQNGIDVIGQKHDQLLAKRDLLKTRLTSMGLKQNDTLRNNESLASLFGRINAAEGRYQHAAGNVDAQVKAYNDLHDAIKQADAAVQGEMRTRSASMALTREDIRTQNVLSKAQTAMSAKNADAQTSIMKTLQKSINQLESAGSPEDKLRALNSITQQTSRLTKATSEYNAQAKHMSKLDSQISQMRTQLKEAGDLQAPESMRLAAKAMNDFKQSKDPSKRTAHAEEVEQYIQQAREDVNRAVKVENTAAVKFDRDSKKAENQYNRITKNDLLAAEDRAEIEKAYKAFNKGRNDKTLEGLQQALGKATDNIAQTKTGDKTAEVQARINAKQLALNTAKERAGGHDNWSDENKALFQKAQDELTEASAQLQSGSITRARSFLGRATTDLGSLNAELVKSEKAIKAATEAQEQRRKEDETVTKATDLLTSPGLDAGSKEARDLQSAISQVQAIQNTGTGDMTQAMTNLTNAMAPADAALKKFEKDANQAEQRYQKLTGSDAFAGLSATDQQNVRDALGAFQGNKTAANLQALKDVMTFADGLIDAQVTGDKKDNYTEKLGRAQDKLTRSEQRNGGITNWTDEQLDMYDRAEQFMKQASKAANEGNFEGAGRSLANFGVAMSRLTDSFSESEKSTAAVEAQRRKDAKEQERIQREQERAAAAEERNLKAEGAKAETAQTRAERNAFYGAIDQDVKDRVTDAAAVYRATGERTDLEEWQKALQSMQRHEMNAEMDSYADRLNRMMNPTGAAGVDLSSGWAAAQVAMRDNLLKLQSDFASALIDPTKQTEAGSILKQIGQQTGDLEKSLAQTKQLNDAAKALETTGNYSRVSQTLKDDLTAAMDAMNNATPDKFLESMNAVRGAISAISNEMKSIGVQDYWNQQTTALQNYNNALDGLKAQHGDVSGWTNSQQAAYAQAQGAFGRAQAAMNAGDQAAYKLASEEGTEKLNALNQSFKEIGALSANSKPQVDALSRSLMNFAAPMMLFRKFTGYMKKAAQNVSAIDSQMADLKKVTNNTDAEYQMFLQRAGQHAVQIGSSITDLVATTSTFAHMGYDLNQSQALGVTATKFANVGGFKNTTDAADTIIAAIKGFKDLNIGDADEVGDKLTAVANNYAVTATDISEGLRHSASALNVAGNDIDQSTAMITAIAEVTRDAGGAGSALKVLSMRIRGAKAELQDAGESTEGMAESTSKLRAEVYGLTNIGGKGGVDIMADENTFKSTYDILQGISKVWGEMSDINRSALLEKLAGKVRSNQVAALLENFDQAERVLETSQGAKGTMSQVHARWMDSVEARQAQFKAAQETASMAALPAGTLKDLYQAGTTGLGWLTKLMGFSGSGGVGLGVLGTATALKSGMGNIWAGIGNAFNRHVGGRGQKDLIDAYNLAFSDATNAGAYHNKAGAMAAAESATGQSANAYTKRLVDQANGTVDAAKATSTLTASLKGLAKNALGAVATFGIIELASAAAQWAWQKLDENVLHRGEHLAAVAEASHAEYSSARQEAKTAEEAKQGLQAQIDSLTVKQTAGTITNEEQSQLAMLQSQMREMQFRSEIADRKASAAAAKSLSDWVYSYDENAPKGSIYSHLSQFKSYDELNRFMNSELHGKASWEQAAAVETIQGAAAGLAPDLRDARVAAMIQEYSPEAQARKATNEKLKRLSGAAEPSAAALALSNAYGLAKLAESFNDEGQLKASDLVSMYTLAQETKTAIEQYTEQAGGTEGVLSANLPKDNDARKAYEQLYSNLSIMSGYMADQTDKYTYEAKTRLDEYLQAGRSASTDPKITAALQEVLQGAIDLTKVQADLSGKDKDLAIFDLMDSILNVTEFGDALDDMTQLAVNGKDVGEIVSTVSDSFPGLADVMKLFGTSVDWAADMAVKNAEKSERGGGGAPVEEIKSSQSRIDSTLTAQALAAKVWKDSGFTGSIDTTSKDYNELMALDGGAYKAAVKHANGALFFDKDAFNRIVQERYKEQFNDLKKDAADAELKYAEAAAKFLKQLDKKEKGEEHDTAAYQNAMADMNLYGGRLSEYRGMMSQIDYGVSGLAGWMDSKKTAESGDVYDELGEAAQVLLSGKKSGKVGTRQFKAALEWYAGEGATPDDLTTEDWNILAGIGAVNSNGKANETVRLKKAQDIRQQLIKLGVMDKNGTVIDPNMTLEQMAEIYNDAYKTTLKGGALQSILMGLNDTIFESDQKYTFGDSSVANQDPAVVAAQDALNKALDAYNSGTGSLEDLAKASKDYLSEMTRATNKELLGSADAEKDPLDAAMKAINASEQEHAAGGGSGGESNKLTDVLSQISGFLDSLNSYLRGEENKPDGKEKPPEGDNKKSPEGEQTDEETTGQGKQQEPQKGSKAVAGGAEAGAETQVSGATKPGQPATTPAYKPETLSELIETQDWEQVFGDLSGEIDDLKNDIWPENQQAYDELRAKLDLSDVNSPEEMSERYDEVRAGIDALKQSVAQTNAQHQQTLNTLRDDITHITAEGVSAEDQKTLEEMYGELEDGIASHDEETISTISDNLTGTIENISQERETALQRVQAMMGKITATGDQGLIEAAMNLQNDYQNGVGSAEDMDALLEKLQTYYDDWAERQASQLTELEQERLENEEKQNMATLHELQTGVDEVIEASGEDDREALLTLLDGLRVGLRTDTQSEFQAKADELSALVDKRKQAQADAEAARQEALDGISGFLNSETVQGYLQSGDQQYDDLFTTLYNYMENGGGTAEEINKLFSQLQASYNGKKLTDKARAEQQERDRIAAEAAAAERERVQRQMDADRENLSATDMPSEARMLAAMAQKPEDLRAAAEAASALRAAMATGDQGQIESALANMMNAVQQSLNGIYQRSETEARLAQERLDQVNGIAGEENLAVYEKATLAEQGALLTAAQDVEDAYNNALKNGDWDKFTKALNAYNELVKTTDENYDQRETAAKAEQAQKDSTARQKSQAAAIQAGMAGNAAAQASLLSAGIREAGINELKATEEEARKLLADTVDLADVDPTVAEKWQALADYVDDATGVTQYAPGALTPLVSALQQAAEQSTAEPRQTPAEDETQTVSTLATLGNIAQNIGELVLQSLIPNAEEAQPEEIPMTPLPEPGPEEADAWQAWVDSGMQEDWVSFLQNWHKDTTEAMQEQEPVKEETPAKEETQTVSTLATLGNIVQNLGKIALQSLVPSGEESQETAPGAEDSDVWQAWVDSGMREDWVSFLQHWEQPDEQDIQEQLDAWEFNGIDLTTTNVGANGQVYSIDELDAYLNSLFESGAQTIEDLLNADNPANGGLGVITDASYLNGIGPQLEQPIVGGQPTAVTMQSEAELEALYDQAEELNDTIGAYLNQYGMDGNEELWNAQQELQNAYRSGDDTNIGKLVKNAEELLKLTQSGNQNAAEQSDASNELLTEGFEELAAAGAKNISTATPGAEAAQQEGEQSIGVGVDYDVPEVELPQPEDLVVGVVADTKKAQEELNSLSASATVTVNWESGGMPESPNSKSDGEGSNGGNTVSISGGTKAASGTTYARSGPYLVDEVGQELIEHVSRGTYELGTNEGPRFTKLDAGDIVHTAKETKRILRRGQSLEKVGKAKTGKAYQLGNHPVGGGNGAQNYPGTTTTRPNQNQGTTKVEGAPIIVTNEEGWLRTTDEILRWLQTVIDWIPTFLAELKKMTNKFVEAADDVVHYSGKNQLVDEAIGNVSKEIQANVMAAMKYREFLMGLAYKGAIPMEALRDIQHGTLDIQKFAVKNGADDTIIKTIQAYQQYWQKLVACQDALKTLNDQMEALSQQKMTNIIKYFDQMGDLLSNQQKTYETLIDLKKQYGQEINVSDYTDSLNTLQDILTNSQNEETAIVAELSDQLGIGEELVKAILDGGREVWEAIGERVKKGVDEGIEDLTNGLDAQNAAITEGMRTGEIPTYWSTVEGQKQITDDESWAASAFGENGTKLVSILDALTADTSAYGPSFSNHTSTIGGMLGIIPEEYINKYGYISMTTKDQKIPNPELLWPVDTSTIELPVKPTLDEDIISIGEMLGLNMADGSEEALANIETVKSLLTTTWDNPLAIGSETWYSYMSTLEELRESIYSTQIEISEMNDEIAKIPLSNLKTGYNYLEDVRKNLEGVNSLLDAQGASKSPGVFSSLISVGMEEIENLQEQNKLIEAQMSALDPLSEKYQELRDDLNDNLDAIADIRENQERWNDALIDLQIDQLRKQNEKYKEQLSLMRALDDLENARQRRILTYHEMGGFVYEADEDALEAAQESATDAVYSSMMSELERQKETSNIYGPLGERLIQGASIVDSLGNILVPVEDKLSGLDFGSYYQSILDGAEQSGLLTNMLNSIDMAKLLESSIGGNVSIDLSGMTLNEVNDVKDLCDAIMQQLPNYLLQAMYQKGA